MEAPNIFILSADSLRTDCCEELQKKLADLTGGVYFTDAVSPATKTSSSMLTMATGRFKYQMHEAEIPEEGDPKPLAEMFEDQGYACGLWTDNYLFGAEYNFDRGFNGGDLGKPTTKKRLSNALGSRPFRPLFPVLEWAYFNIYKQLSSVAGKEENFYRPAEQLNEAVMAWLSEQSGPTFSWIHYMDHHHPYEPPRAYLEEVALNGSWNRGELAQFTRQAVKSNGKGYAEKELEDVRAAYKATCDYFEDELFAFVRRLIKEGHYSVDRDLLVFTADHGECLSPDRYGMMGHVPPAIWEEVIRVPLVVGKPNWARRTIDEQISLAEFYDIVASVHPSSEDLSPADVTGDIAYFATNWGIGDGDAVQTYRGIRRSDGTKLFGARLQDEDRVVLAEYDCEPIADSVLFVSDGSETPDEDRELADRWHKLRSLAAVRGNLVVDKRQTGATLDDQHLQDLGYLE